jgi:hypothetical protein
VNLLDYLAIPGGALMLVAAVWLWRRGARAGTTLPHAGPPEEAFAQVWALFLGGPGLVLVLGECLRLAGVLP